MKTWYEIYMNRVNEQYRAYFFEAYNPYFAMLDEAGTSFFEAGCGAGTCSALLDGEVSMIDCNLQMLDLAKQQMVQIGINAVIEQGNILDIDDYAFNGAIGKVIHSHGVLEHFSDEDIHKILAIQLSVTNKPIIHYVPTDGYDEPSRGDERLLPIKHWVGTFKPSHYVTNGADLYMRWR